MFKIRKQCCSCYKTFYKTKQIKIEEEYVETYFDFETSGEGYIESIYKEVYPHCLNDKYIIV